MSLSYFSQDPQEIFNLLLNIREFVTLWLETRKKQVKNEEISKEEMDRLGELIEELSDSLEILPFSGSLLKLIITNRPIFLQGWLGDITGIPEAVNKLLALLIEYLSYKCDHVIWYDISRNPGRINEYLKTEPQKEANGLMFEIIIRRWLREIKGKHWVNTQSFRTPIIPRDRHGIEIDAFSITKEQNQYNVAAAEIKWTLALKPSGEAFQIKHNREISVSEKFSDNLISLANHFEEWQKIKINYKEIALISGNPISTEYKQSAKNFLAQKLTQLNVKQDMIQIYDIDDVWETVRHTEHSIKNVIEEIRKLR